MEGRVGTEYEASRHDTQLIPELQRYVLLDGLARSRRLTPIRPPLSSGQTDASRGRGGRPSHIW
jgi:hypothetical protein